MTFSYHLHRDTWLKNEIIHSKWKAHLSSSENKVLYKPKGLVRKTSEVCQSFSSPTTFHDAKVTVSQCLRPAQCYRRPPQIEGGGSQLWHYYFTGVFQKSTCLFTTSKNSYWIYLGWQFLKSSLDDSHFSQAWKLLPRICQTCETITTCICTSNWCRYQQCSMILIVT